MGRRSFWLRFAAVFVLLTLGTAGLPAPVPASPARGSVGPEVLLQQADFAHGTYIIDRPGTYRLAEDISFNPNSPDALTAALRDGTIPPGVAAALDLSSPVDAYRAGMPLPTQFATEPGPFSPGGPLDQRYDPAAYGVGFFAAIVVAADDVVVDLAGHTLEQSEEHALLQRFFALIELADQPFLPSQGPSGFGTEITPARQVTIHNGTLGRSSHHGIHGNLNEDVRVEDVDFRGYEVGAIALNGVKGLVVEDVTATNRKDIPVLGTFSSGQFIKPYIDHLVRSGSTATLTVDGHEIDAASAQASLRAAINAVHHDIIVEPNTRRGRAVISGQNHPAERSLFHNPSGLIDGNSYSFLTNGNGVAVNGFPHAPAPAEESSDVVFEDVEVYRQHADITEIVALDADPLDLFGKAMIDPVGAVFQVFNSDPSTGEPVTMSSLDPAQARYTGNVVANAQALVAKAAAAGDFDGSQLDISRTNFTDEVLDWVEGEPGSETLASVTTRYLCNGDSMFHVNKGAIAFKMDAVRGLTMTDVSVRSVRNEGDYGSDRCGDYTNGYSHGAATLEGYGGAWVRGISLAGATDVEIEDVRLRGLVSDWGSAAGVDILTDSSDISLEDVRIRNVKAGRYGPIPVGHPGALTNSYGVRIGANVGEVEVEDLRVRSLKGHKISDLRDP